MSTMAGPGFFIGKIVRPLTGDLCPLGLHITPEPKPISVVIVALKGRLSPAAEKFWQCAKEASAKK